MISESIVFQYSTAVVFMIIGLSLLIVDLPAVIPLYSSLVFIGASIYFYYHGGKLRSLRDLIYQNCLNGQFKPMISTVFLMNQLLSLACLYIVFYTIRHLILDVGLPSDATNSFLEQRRLLNLTLLVHLIFYTLITLTIIVYFLTLRFSRSARSTKIEHLLPNTSKKVLTKLIESHYSTDLILTFESLSDKLDEIKAQSFISSLMKNQSEIFVN